MDYQTDDFPSSSHFDSSEVISSEKIPERGRIITLNVHSNSIDLLKGITIMKSDVAVVSIPEIQLEEAPGTGRYQELKDLLNDMRDRLQSSASFFPALSRFLYVMDDFLEGRKPFTLVIDDPLSLSFIKLGAQTGATISYNHYIRTWEQDEELGLVKPKENVFSDEEAVEKLVKLIKESKKIAVFSGAGVSVGILLFRKEINSKESGIPAYRGGDNAIWTKYNEQDADYNKFMQFEETRIRYWQMKTEFYEILRNASPNFSHFIFNFLNKQGKLLGVITQNIDGMYQRAGIPSEKVVPLHGEDVIVQCSNCPLLYSRDEIQLRVSNGEKVPKCSCGGYLRPGTIMFGEKLKDEVVEKAKKILSECDLLIIMGTSLVVQPANKLPLLCLNHGVPMVIINKDGNTKYDSHADLLVDRSSGETMKQVMEILQQ